MNSKTKTIVLWRDLTQGHLHPKLEVPGLTCPGRESNPGLHGNFCPFLEVIPPPPPRHRTEMKADLIKVELTPENIAPKQASCNRSNALSLQKDRLTAVFRIHEILGWIRIRIRGSMPLTSGSKELIFNTIFSAYYFLTVHLHHFLKIKSQKEPQNSRNQGFSYYFSMMMEGSVSGSIPLTSGSGSGRPKNMWIRWIRIRIRNTD